MRFGTLLAVLVLSTLVAVTSARAIEIVATYTPEQLREMAIYYNQFHKGKKFYAVEPALKAMEFKGYVAGALDSRKPNSKLNDCVRRNTLAAIASRTASVIESTPLDRAVPAAITLWVALYFACDDKQWK